MAIFDIKGASYHVEIAGEGFPLLLLHGFTGDAATWHPFRERWGTHSQLLMVDLIGHGKTDSPEALERYDILSVADDLNALLDEWKVEKTDVLGYSMGGRLAITFALRYPHRVRKLILESTSPGLEQEAQRIERQANDRQLASFILEEGIERFVSRWEGIPLFQTQERLPEVVRARIRQQRLSNSKIGLANSLIGMGTGAQPSWWGELEQIPCEVLILTGTLDKKFCDIAERMVKKLKNGQWVKIEHCGHTIHVEEPEIFGTIVKEFLQHT
jgi:2-succinyl-6-hydroxy-2,4-cyclohexadiene-1-carboxylate synthase